MQQKNGMNVLESTTKIDHIEQLLCDVLRLYAKFTNRNRSPLNSKKVKQSVSSMAAYIFTTYHPVQRRKFEAKKKYFSRMIENYGSCDSGQSEGAFFLELDNAWCPYDGINGQWRKYGASDSAEAVDGYVVALQPASHVDHVMHHAGHAAHHAVHHAIGAVLPHIPVIG